MIIFATAFIVSLIPVLMWFWIDPTLQRFESFSYAIYSLGQIFVLIGLALFAFNIFLSGRFKWFEKVFGPINRIYIAHHLLGIVTWVLLLMHPLGLTAVYGYRLFIPEVFDVSRFLGVVALVFFDVLIVLSLYRKIPYHVWKFSHSFLGVVLIIGSLHGFLIESDIKNSVVLRIYFLLILTIAMGTYLYRTVFPKLFVKHTKYKVISCIERTGGVVSILMKPVLEPLIFLPGQFAFFSFEQKGFSESHPFSISSGPLDKNLEINVKKLGDYTNLLSNISIGTLVDIEGAFGKFSYMYARSKELIWIAGGIGITPFLAMAKSLPLDVHVVIYYCIKNASEDAFSEKLKELQNANSFKFIVYCSDISGRISAKQIIEEQKLNPKESDIFLCGPPAMMKSLRSQFNALGYRHSRIHSEEFSL